MSAKASTETKNLRFGLLCNSLVLEQWQADTIQQLIESGIYPVIVLVNDNQEEAIRGLKKLWLYPWKRLFFRLWSRYFFRPTSKKPADIQHFIATCEPLLCHTQRKGIANLFDQQTIELVRASGADFLLRFGFGIIKGDILQATTYGVWSFHHDDEQVIRGGPPGFWEIFYKHATNAVILQQLTESLDNGLILKKIRFRTIHHSYREHLDQLYFGASFLPLAVCRQILSGSFIRAASSSTAKILHPPTNGQLLAFGWGSLRRRIIFHLNDLFRQEDWQVGIVKRSDFEKTGLQADIQWLLRPNPTSYTADPFVVDFEGDTLLFFESYDYRYERGHLAMAKASEGFKKYYKVLEREQHFSFPSVFVYEGALFCLPECFESRTIKLFRFEPDRQTFIEYQTLMNEVDAVDPLLWFHDNKWWLFFTKKNQPSVHLYLFIADQLTGPYRPHANNPVKSEIGSSRPAGLILEKDGKYFRPSQDCSSSYGIAVVVNEITEISEHSYSEKPVQRYEPQSGWKLRQGLHTINFSQHYMALDAKGFRFFYPVFYNRLLTKFRVRKR